MGRPAAIEVSRLKWSGGTLSAGHRTIPDEVPIALTYDGTAYAVMMATPSDLADFALGFSLSEGVVDHVSEIESLEIVEVDGGIEARMWLQPAASARNRGRRRAILGPTGCGLCGVDSIAEALKPLPKVGSNALRVGADLINAMAALQKRQVLNAQARAVHAAGLWLGQDELIVREDVGRHNGLDKIIGAAAASDTPASNGVVLLTSRVSVELVQKTARLGASIIAAISAPTALAVKVADEAGITLAAVLRGEDFEIFTRPERITGEARRHEARETRHDGQSDRSFLCQPEG
jgi:FdhD protein